MSFDFGTMIYRARNTRRVNRLVLCIALLALPACSKKGNEIPPDKASGPGSTPSLPPSISASHTYRCNDNSLVFIDFMSDGMTLDLRGSKEALPNRMTAPAPGEPFIGDEATATVNNKTIVLQRYKAPSRTCRRN
jgi:hypothetical protein